MAIETTDIEPLGVSEELLLELANTLLFEAQRNTPAGMLAVKTLAANQPFPDADRLTEPACRATFVRHIEPHRRGESDPSVDDVELIVHLGVPSTLVEQNAYVIGRSADTIRRVLSNRTARDTETGTELRVRNAQVDLDLAPSDNPLIHVAELRFAGDVRKPG